MGLKQSTVTLFCGKSWRRWHEKCAEVFFFVNFLLCLEYAEACPKYEVYMKIIFENSIYMKITPIYEKCIPYI